MITFENVMTKLNISINIKRGKIDKMTNKKLGEALGISPNNIASMKRRETIPYKKIIDYCLENSMDLNYIFKD